MTTDGSKRIFTRYDEPPASPLIYPNRKTAVCESTSFEGSVARVGEAVATVSTPESGTVVPALDGGFTTFWTESFFPSLLTETLDLRIERLWAQHY